MTAPSIKLVEPLVIADARLGVGHIFIRDLVLACSIGIHDHERDDVQRVRINLNLAVHESAAPTNDEICNVVCYEKIATATRQITTSKHFNLVETLAEEIAAMCLKNPRVKSARVRVEKIDVFKDAAGAGIEIERYNSKG